MTIMTINMRHILALSAVAAGCDYLGPRVEDIRADAPPAVPRPDAPPIPQPDAAIDSPPPGPAYLLPVGSVVPHISEDTALVAQIQINDGLSDTALAQAGGVLMRSTGKAGGATVMFWNFGATPMAGSFAVAAPVYILAESNGAGGYQALSHPLLIDSIPGDERYSAIRREYWVPVTANYQGEVITSIHALGEAIERGIVAEPLAKGTWRNMPVVPPGTKLDVGGVAGPAPTTVVYARGHRVELFELGGDRGIQPLRNGGIPVGQESRLFSGVASGTPPSKTSSADAMPVFQYGIPAAAPTTAFNYTPLATQLDVRLANTVAPSVVLDDAQMFRRSTTGAIMGYYVDAVESYTVTTNVTNRQIQFQEGQP